MAVEPNCAKLLSQLTKKLTINIKVQFGAFTYLDSFDSILNLVDTSLRGECVDTTIVVFLATVIRWLNLA